MSTPSRIIEEKGTNIEEFAVNFGDDVSFSAMQKLQSVLCDDSLKAFAANVLIGNIMPRKASESVGTQFSIKGFSVENFKSRDGKKEGKYVIMFGDGFFNHLWSHCAFSTTSIKIFEALYKIVLVYGEPSNWGEDGIKVMILLNQIVKENGENIEYYTLKILE